MKLTAIIFLSVLMACSNNNTSLVKSAESKASENAKGIVVPPVECGVEGFYTGIFEATKYDPDKEVFDNQLTICIDSIGEKNIYGHSIVAGNDRPFSGSYHMENNDYIVSVQEPGDNKYDGIFKFAINSKGKSLSGTWHANNNLPVTERKYKLAYNSYSYSPSFELPGEIIESPIYGTYNKKTGKQEVLTGDVLTLNASQKLLKSSDVENVFATDLEVIRNAIYARHGYSFKNLRMRTLFDNAVDWYMPASTDVTSLLTEIEKKNIELIKRYEKHATKYYDVFGR